MAMRFQGLLVRAGITILLAGALGGCHAGSTPASRSAGGSSPTRPASTAPTPAAASPTPTAPAVTVVSGVEPGQSTPQAAAAAFIDANANSDIPSACRYVVPPEQGTCPAFIAAATLGAVAPVTIGKTDIVGDQAIVTAVGKLCTTQACQLNTDPSTGQPTTSAGFPAAYLDAANGVSLGRPDLACQKIGGLWYIELNLVTAFPSSLPGPSSR